MSPPYTLLRRILPLCVIVASGLLAAAATASAEGAIELRRRQIEVAAAVPRAAARPGADRRLQLVQFDRTPTDADIERLLATGARIIAPVPRDAYLVWTEDVAQVAALAPARLQAIRRRLGFEPLDALAPALDDRVDDDTPVDVTVQLVADTQRTTADLSGS